MAVITDALYYIDITRETYINDSCLIMYYTKGGVTKEQLDKMGFDEFELWKKQALAVQEALNKKPEGEE